MHCLDMAEAGLIYNVSSKQREKRKKEEICVLQNMWWEWATEKTGDEGCNKASS